MKKKNYLIDSGVDDELIETLIQKKANIHQIDKNGQTALHYVARSSMLSLFQKKKDYWIHFLMYSI